MDRCYSYVIARLPSHPARDERLNVAIVVFDEHQLEVKQARSLEKIRAISAAVNTEKLRETLDNLVKLDTFGQSQGCTNVQSRLDMLKSLTFLEFSSVSEFYARDFTSRAQQLELLRTKLVEPEPIERGSISKPTKLLRDVKSAFRNERVLARKGEDLDAHRLVSNYKVAEGLSAELILKNGSMHVIQTADAVISEASPRRMIASIAISALVFEQARMGFGDQNTRSRLIYRASGALENTISPSLEAAEHQGAKLINWESRDDRNRFIVELSSLAQPIPKSNKDSFSMIHASTQRKLDLN